jgi:aromatic ring hydroxylase
MTLIEDSQPRLASRIDSALDAPLGPGALTGARYLDSLDDGREVWVNGERIANVATHPTLAPCALELARIYDLQSGKHQDEMTYVNERGVRVSLSYLEPRSYDDLLKRRRNAELWAQNSFGMLGRYPDFCAAITIGFKDVGDELATFDPSFAVNSAWHHRWSADNDLCLGHGLHDPNMDKSLRPQQDPDRCLRAVRETDAGIIVRGARFITLGALSHEVQIAPTYVLNENEPEFALWFAVPVNTKGLKMVCREPFANRNQFDHPASSRFDEQDVLAIFDDVLVPWDRVFLYRQPEAANRLFRTRVMTWAVYAAAVQLLSRIDLLIGTSYLVAETGGTLARPEHQQLIGELVMYRSIFQSILRASEVDHTTTKSGLKVPGALIHQRAFIGQVSERLVGIVERIGSSSIIFNHSHADLIAPELQPLLDVYGRGKDIDAVRRTQLCKLAWDLTGDSFGGRQQLYERLHSGDPDSVLRANFSRYNPKAAKDMVASLLGWTDGE